MKGFLNMQQTPSPLTIRTMTMDDIDQVVDIHRRCFPPHISLYSALNSKLAWHLYAMYVEEPESCGMVLVDSQSDKIAGFTAGTMKPGFSKRFLLSHFCMIVWYVMIGLLTKPVIWKMVLRAVFSKKPIKAYHKNPLQFEHSAPNGLVAYFMPIAMNPDYRGGGNAVRLARALMDHFFELGAVRIRGNKIAIDNMASRKLFVEKLGWNSSIIENDSVVTWIDKNQVSSQ